MVQAGRSRKLRKVRGARNPGAIAAGVQGATEAAIRRGVVPGAEPEVCPVCGANSEGWYIEGGKRTWYHFGRSFNCVEKVDHIEADAKDGFRGAVPGVW